MEYFIVLIAALFHAIWNSMIKDSGDKLLSLTAIRIVGFIFGLLVVFFLPPLAKDAIPYLVVAAFIHFLYFWFLLNIYRVGDFSQVYPISRGTAPLIVLVLAAVFAGENLSGWQVSAILMISFGILMLSFNRGRLTVIPVGYALGTACCIAGYTVVSGMGVRIAGSFLTYAGWLEAVCGIAVILFTFFKRGRQVFIRSGTQWIKGFFAGILSISAFAAALWAMTTAPLASIAALRETSIIFAAIIGAVILKEGHAPYRVSAASIVAAGIAILIHYS